MVTCHVSLIDQENVCKKCTVNVMGTWSWKCIGNRLTMSSRFCSCCQGRSPIPHEQPRIDNVPELYSLMWFRQQAPLVFSARISCMTRKSDKAEIDRRIHIVFKLLSSANTSSYVIRLCSEEWGVGQRMAEKYLSHDRQTIRLITQSNDLTALACA